MNQRLQDAIMRTYRVVLHTGVFETRLGYYLLERCYDAYKSVLEAPSLRHIRPFVRVGSTVLDVGAHCGFHTKRFGGWVGPEGRIIALEPEPINFARLQRRVARLGFQGRVTALNVAAAERCDSLFLRIDPEDPADHRLAESGHPIVGKTLDAIMAAGDWPPLSLVKLDIQGAEVRALRGAGETLARRRPTLLVEVDDARLRHQGSSACELVALLTDAGYLPRPLGRRGVGEVVEPEVALALVDGPGSYADFLFVDRDRRERLAARGTTPATDLISSPSSRISESSD